MQTKYNVSEDIFSADVCVQVFNPGASEDLVFGIDMIIRLRSNTAGKFSVILESYNINMCIPWYHSLQMDQTI